MDKLDHWVFRAIKAFDTDAGELHVTPEEFNELRHLCSTPGAEEHWATRTRDGVPPIWHVRVVVDRPAEERVKAST